MLYVEHVRIAAVFTLCAELYERISQNVPCQATDPEGTCTRCLIFSEGLEKLYELSYLWYTAAGILVTVIIGVIVSFVTGACNMNDVTGRNLVKRKETLRVY